MHRYIEQGTLEELSGFLSRYYLQEYIASGESKIKFLTGSEGSGKSYFLSINEKEAATLGYKTVCLSARDVPLYDFKELYAAVMSSIDLSDVVARIATQAIIRLGYEPSDIPEGMNFLDYLASRDEADALTRRAIRNDVKAMFFDNPYFDNNFALAVSMLVGDYLGHPRLDEVSKATLHSWLLAEKDVKMPAIRLAGLAPSKINKTNARQMLSSLVETLLLAKYKGFAIYIDDFDAILNRTGLDAVHYTKMRREDTYESVRELIDAIDSMKNVFFAFAFDRILLDDENAGLKSYQALWMRIQNEIRGARFNCFADILDLDHYGEHFFDAKTLRGIYENYVSSYTNPNLDLSISDEELLALKEKSKSGNLGILALLEDALRGKVEQNRKEEKRHE